MINRVYAARLTADQTQAFDEGKLNFDKVMINFARWYYQDLFTPTGEMFDVGNTCSLQYEKDL